MEQGLKQADFILWILAFESDLQNSGGITSTRVHRVQKLASHGYSYLTPVNPAAAGVRKTGTISQSRAAFSDKLTACGGVAPDPCTRAPIDGRGDRPLGNPFGCVHEFIRSRRQSDRRGHCRRGHYYRHVNPTEVRLAQGSAGTRTRCSGYEEIAPWPCASSGSAARRRTGGRFRPLA